MNKIMKKHSINILFFSAGIIAVFAGGLLYKSINTLTAKPLKRPQVISRVENKIRKKSKDFREMGLKTEISRTKEGLILRIWEDNLFPISHWRPDIKNANFFNDLAKIIKNTGDNVKLEISSHYDSVNPHISGAKGDRKYIITKKRANIIANIFLKEGLRKDDLSIRAYGDTSPLVNDRDLYGTHLSREGRLNRRVELFMKFKDRDVF